MKPMLQRAVLLLMLSLTVAACSTEKKRQQAEEARRAVTAKPVTAAYDSDGSKRVQFEGVDIVKMPFRAGVSSATVESLAKKAGCMGGPGAGLVSEPGPVEVYRMVCDNGTTYLAKCELRQCRTMW